MLWYSALVGSNQKSRIPTLFLLFRPGWSDLTNWVTLEILKFLHTSGTLRIDLRIMIYCAGADQNFMLNTKNNTIDSGLLTFHVFADDFAEDGFVGAG